MLYQSIGYDTIFLRFACIRLRAVSVLLSHQWRVAFHPCIRDRNRRFRSPFHTCAAWTELSTRRPAVEQHTGFPIRRCRIERTPIRRKKYSKYKPHRTYEERRTTVRPGNVRSNSLVDDEGTEAWVRTNTCSVWPRGIAGNPHLTRLRLPRRMVRPQ